MNKIIIILIPLLPFLVKAQQQPGQSFIYSNSGFTWSTTSVSSISDIGVCSTAKGNTIVVTDTIRGGTFVRYVGNDTVDNGIIFSDATGSKWRRSVNEGERINIAWYGLSTAASIASPTNYNAFMAAYNYAATHSWDGGLFIPQGTYNFNQTITIDTSIDIKGVGNFYDWRTILVFPENVKAFRMLTAEGSLANTVVDMSDIEVRGNAEYINPGSLTLDSSKHAFDISCIVHFFEVNVNGYAGNGFNVDACANPGASNFGNSDNSYFIYCGASLCNNGIYFNGCDANIVTVHNGNFTLNRRYGIRDNGFLGNNYQKNHTAYNGVYKTFCTVLYNGVYYAAINADTILNVNKQPDINPTYWQVIDFTPYTVNNWNNSTRYWQGGAALIENVNNYSLILGDYTEGGQPPIRNRGRALTIGGDNGSGQAEGAWIYADDNRVWVKNATLVLENLNTTGSVIFTGYTGIPVLSANGTLSTITGTANQVLRRNAANNGFEFAAASGGVSQSALDDTATNIRSTIPSRVWLSGDVVNNNAVANTIADVTGLSFPVVAGSKYYFKFFIVYSSAATTTGSRWAINGPAATFMHFTSQYPTSATAITNNTSLAGYNLPAAANASSLTTGNIAIIEGIILPSSNGNVIARFASEISSSAITAIGGRCYVEYNVIQ